MNIETDGKRTNEVLDGTCPVIRLARNYTPIADCDGSSLPLHLNSVRSYFGRRNVVKINPAVRLYERLGFEITHEDDRKFYMKLDPDMATPLVKLTHHTNSANTRCLL